VRPASAPGTDASTDKGSERGANGNSNEWTAEKSETKGNAKGCPNQYPYPQGVIHRRAAGRLLSLVGLLQRGNIEFAHPEHGLHGTLGPLRIGAADQRSER
jgi:hypothetical protein